MRALSWLAPCVMWIVVAAPVNAQVPTGPTLGQPVEAEEPVALPPDKQQLIRDHAARSDLPTADLAEPARVGMIIPREVALLTLPEDARTVTPTVTSYSYVIAGDVIAIVDPESRKVIQLVKR